jgi:hypothetical protein
VKIKKSSINEFNQTFWDSTLKKIPRKWRNTIKIAV